MTTASNRLTQRRLITGAALGASILVLAFVLNRDREVVAISEPVVLGVDLEAGRQDVRSTDAARRMPATRGAAESAYDAGASASDVLSEFSRLTNSELISSSELAQFDPGFTARLLAVLQESGPRQKEFRAALREWIRAGTAGAGMEESMVKTLLNAEATLHHPEVLQHLMRIGSREAQGAALSIGRWHFNELLAGGNQKAIGYSPHVFVELAKGQCHGLGDLLADVTDWLPHAPDASRVLSDQAYFAWALLDDPVATKDLRARLREQDPARVTPALEGMISGVLARPEGGLARELLPWSVGVLGVELSDPGDIDARRMLAWIVDATRGKSALARLQMDAGHVTSGSNAHQHWLLAMNLACRRAGNQFDVLRAVYEGAMAPTETSDPNGEIGADLLHVCIETGGDAAVGWLVEQALATHDPHQLYLLLDALPSSTWAGRVDELSAVLERVADRDSDDVFEEFVLGLGLPILLENGGPEALAPFRQREHSGLASTIRNLDSPYRVLRREESRRLAALDSSQRWASVRERYADPTYMQARGIYQTISRELVEAASTPEEASFYLTDPSAPIELRLLLTKAVFQSNAVYRAQVLASALPVILDEVCNSRSTWQMVASFAVHDEDLGTETARTALKVAADTWGEEVPSVFSNALDVLSRFLKAGSGDQ